MEAYLGARFNPSSPLLTRRSPSPLLIPRLPSKPLSVSVFRGSLPGNVVAREDVMQMFVKEREISGDLITKASDVLWRRDGFKLDDSETSPIQENIQQQEEEEETVEEDSIGGFLKLTKTKEWISGDDIAPVNKRLAAKDWQNDREKRKQLNFLRYEALKRELLLVTVGIGAACTGYCLITLSVEAAISYAFGVLCRMRINRCRVNYTPRRLGPAHYKPFLPMVASFGAGKGLSNANKLYEEEGRKLQTKFLCHHTDNLSKEGVPRIFLHKKLKKIGIRSEDLEIMFEKVMSGSAMALSSPRLIIPAAIYGFWALSNHFLIDYFDFQLVPGMVGFFAYKAGALVQVYRDNEDLKMVFADNDTGPRNS